MDHYLHFLPFDISQESPHTQEKQKIYSLQILTPFCFVYKNPQRGSARSNLPHGSETLTSITSIFGKIYQIKPMVTQSR